MVMIMSMVFTYIISIILMVWTMFAMVTMRMTMPMIIMFGDIVVYTKNADNK